MELREKLEILIKRNSYKKTDFADALGITYRGLANYLSGTRYPRKKIIENMAILLDVDAELLTDNDKTINLSSDEKLYFYGKSDKAILEKCDSLLNELDDIFHSEIDDVDKTSFFNCIAEKYFSSKVKKNIDR